MYKKLVCLALLIAPCAAASAHEVPPRYVAIEIPNPVETDPACLSGYATSLFGLTNNRRFVAGGAGCFRNGGVLEDGSPFISTVYVPFAWSPLSGAYLLPRINPAALDGLALNVDDFNNAYGYEPTGSALDGVKWSQGGGVQTVFGTDPACGFGISFATGANLRGEIAGEAFRFDPLDPLSCQFRMVVRRPSGEEVSGPTGNSSNINNSGVVAGQSDTHAVKWNSRSGQTTVLRIDGPTERSSGSDINDSETVAGSILTDTGDSCLLQTAALWDRRGRERRLPHLPGAISSYTQGINNDGDSVGASSPVACMGRAVETVRATLWRDGRVFDLSRLLVARPLIVLTAALNINDRGEITATGYRTVEPLKPCPQQAQPGPDRSVCHDQHLFLLVPLY